MKHKFIRNYTVTDAAVHDSKVFEELLDDRNTSADVWADSAYCSSENVLRLGRLGYREHIQRKGCRHKPLTEREKRANRTRSKIRSRVEHVFGVQAKKAGNSLLRSIGIMRACCKMGLRNLAYNMDRYSLIAT